ncbi:hypothetical protein Pint_06832 [Pistacia integerrima]|uniref:Uncharacterized protein n=1 Tax=Pistacia integerrima TaxID=434235 RepID=A0ACC0XYG0_9ROSI|nr:hypothetical protein Pint_06832 [Pistacia integerrima]
MVLLVLIVLLLRFWVGSIKDDASCAPLGLYRCKGENTCFHRKQPLRAW